MTVEIYISRLYFNRRRMPLKPTYLNHKPTFLRDVLPLKCNSNRTCLRKTGLEGECVNVRQKDKINVFAENPSAVSARRDASSTEKYNCVDKSAYCCRLNMSPEERSLWI